MIKINKSFTILLYRELNNTSGVKHGNSASGVKHGNSASGVKHGVTALVLFGLLFLFNLSVYPETVDVSTSVFSFGYKTGVSSVSMVVKEVDTNIEKSSVTWGTQMLGAGWQSAERYVEVSFQCNYYNWYIVCHTSNTGANTGYQKGGLLSTSASTAKIPVGWVVSDSTVPVNWIIVGEPGELTKSTVTYTYASGVSSGTILSAWKYIKDVLDEDDPNTTAWNESWNGGGVQSGYAKVIYGSANYSRSSEGVNVVSPVVIYFEANFSEAEGKMRYQSTIYFDLVFQ